MNWRRVSDYCIRSDSGYTVSKFVVGGKVHFEAYDKKKVFIGRADEPATAKEMCETDAMHQAEALKPFIQAASA